MKNTTLALIAIGFGIANAAFAQEAAENNPLFKAMEQACKTDADQYCGGKGTPQCLRQNEAKLSHQCKDARDKLEAAIEATHPDTHPAFIAMSRTCKADSDKYCAGMKGMKLGDCMEDHAEKLSSQCKQARDKLEADEAAQQRSSGAR